MNNKIILEKQQRKNRQPAAMDEVLNMGSFLRLLMSITLAVVKAKHGCKEFEYLPCVQNKTLTGHVIKSLRVTGLEMCQTKCFSEESEGECVSYNLGPVDGLTRMCELSSSDHWSLPKFLISKEGFEYCPIKNPCSSSPCPQGKLCTPDFSWDTYHCKEGWWTKWGSWSTCFLPKTCQLQTRKRKCSNPLTSNQVQCDTGAGLESRNCKVHYYDTTGCEGHLGMEDGRIKDSQIKGSTWWSQDWLPKEGRLKAHRAWIPRKSTNGEYIQVDLLKPTFITMVATQGRPLVNQWVTKYKLAYSNDGQSWNEYKGDCIKIFPGNSNYYTIVTNKLEVPIKARYLRLIIQGHSNHPSIRMEIYGCVKDNLPLH